MTDKLLTSSALSAQAITLAAAHELEEYIDNNLEAGEILEIPEHLKKTFDIAWRYHQGRLLN